jgi:hypothetical protein
MVHESMMDLVFYLEKKNVMKNMDYFEDKLKNESLQKLHWEENYERRCSKASKVNQQRHIIN